MGRLKDITGNIYGLLTVVEKNGVDSTGKITWLCECSCGGKVVATGLNLKSGNTKSCGCLRRVPNFHDRTGEVYGRLTVLRIASRRDGKISWHCKCDCGNSTTVSTAHLISSHTRSCGCLSREVSAKNAKRYLSGKKENHPRWRADLTKEERERRRGEDGKQWADTVKRRDGYTCVACGQGGNLQSHHIVPYSYSRDRRLDLSNGVCLCKKCHISFHRKHGYGTATRDDFFSFFGMPDPGDFSVVASNPPDIAVDAIKYIWRAGDKGSEVEDLKKARWYLDREIARLEQ